MPNTWVPINAMTSPDQLKHHGSRANNAST